MRPVHSSGPPAAGASIVAAVGSNHPRVSDRENFSGSPFCFVTPLLAVFPGRPGQSLRGSRDPRVCTVTRRCHLPIAILGTLQLEGSQHITFVRKNQVSVTHLARVGITVGRYDVLRFSTNENPTIPSTVLWGRLTLGRLLRPIFTEVTNPCVCPISSNLRKAALRTPQTGIVGNASSTPVKFRA
jgi:hypothetical protein